MNIVLTGSLGHISKPLTQILVQKGHSVTVISSKAERQKDIEALGAKVAIGTMEDEMNAGRRSDVLYEDYNRHKPTLGKVKLKDFAKEFALVFNSKQTNNSN